MFKKRSALRILCIFMLFITMAGGITSVSANPFSEFSILGSWYGEYQEPFFRGSTYVECYDAYMTVTVNNCDKDGNFSGEGYTVSNTTGDIHEGSWLRFGIKGNLDFSTGDFYMEQTHQIATSNGSTVSYENYTGTLKDDRITGVVRNDNHEIPEVLTFSFGKVSEWASEEVTEANSIGLIPEQLRGEDLSKQVSREEFAAIALKMYENISEKTAEPAENPYTDIAKSGYYDEILKATALGITDGIGKNQFAPNRSITREEMATMLTRAYKKSEFEDWTLETDNKYALNSMGVLKFDDDALISDYARESVYFMAKWEIINGIGNNLFAPRGTATSEEGYGYATREQAIVIALRSVKHL